MNLMTTTTTVKRPSSFKKKSISITFNIFTPSGGFDTLALSESHRIRATVSHAGLGIGSILALTIEGMNWNDLNRLSYVPNYPNAQNPTTTNQGATSVTVTAGDSGRAMKVLFIGSVTESYVDFSSGSAIFSVKARTIMALSDVTPSPLSLSGSQSVPYLLSLICEEHGLIFDDRGGWRGSQLSNAYSGGTLLDQISHIIHAAGGVFDFISHDGNSTTQSNAIGKLVAWGSAYGGNEDKTQETPLISAKTGLISYPQYTSSGIAISCLFRPDISFFTPCAVKSDFIPAGWSLNSKGINTQGQQIGSIGAPWDGLWLPYYIVHDISSQSVGAPWLTKIEAQMTNTQLTNAYK